MFLTQIINGQVTELALCEACARAKGLFDPQSLTFAEKFFPEELKERMDRIIRELSGREELPMGSDAKKASPDVLTQCPSCHFTLDRFRATGHLGCPDCYTVFAAELDGQRSPRKDAAEPGADESSPLQQRRKLEQQLHEAIEKEDYETAAHLRDKLKLMD